MENIRQEIRAFVNENFLFGQMDGRLSDEDSFLQRGIIDSTGVLELVHFVEEKYVIRLEDEELVPENLDSVARLAAFIHAKVRANREN
jgi:acyl carrier protein